MRDSVVHMNPLVIALKVKCANEKTVIVRV
jgi:hypothetical protein